MHNNAKSFAWRNRRTCITHVKYENFIRYKHINVDDFDEHQYFFENTHYQV